MPYKVREELPEGVKALPAHAQDIYLSAFNAAWEEYKDRGERREALAHATAWAAVKNKYEKKGEEWVAKETKMAEANTMSDEDRRRVLQGALDQRLKPSFSAQVGNHPWIRDVYETDLIYDLEGILYRIPFSLEDSGEVVFGEPVKVIATTTYKTVESLRARYAELLQEAGRRNAAADANRIKKIVELCNELLSSETVEEAKAIEALKEANAALLWLREQAVAKTEDGEQYPASAYAYMPDAEKPSTWKLRLWEDPEKKVTRVQLGKAAAALSPGGFRGQKVEIPRDDLSAVKRKIRAEYRKLDVADEDIPKWVQEAESRLLLSDYIPLQEAKVGEKGLAQVVIIRPGFNSNKSRYYPKETLARDYKVFEGLKMFADHPTEKEDKERPERRIRDWVATLKNTRIAEDGSVVGDAVVVEPWLQQRLTILRDRAALGDMGVSINAVGKGSKAQIDGVKTDYIEQIVRGRSVDFVTEPGAGGTVQLYESGFDLDIDFVGLAILKERRPDLVAQIVQELKEEVKTMAGLEEQIATLAKERDALKGQVEEAQRARMITEAKAKVEEVVGKSGLPEPAKKRLLEQFANATDTKGIDEVIKAEAGYVAALQETGKVRDLGGTAPAQADEKALKESWKRLHPEWTDAQVDTAVRGR